MGLDDYEREVRHTIDMTKECRRMERTYEEGECSLCGTLRMLKDKVCNHCRWEERRRKE